MPIRAISEIRAREAAAAERKQAAAQVPLAPKPPSKSSDAGLPEPPRRGHAVKDERGKWLPTGNYDSGWCQPPQATRFKKGCKPGPGRPRGTVSHDTLLKKHLGQKRRIRVDGRERDVATREIVLMTTVKAAAEGKDREARKYVLQEMARIYGGEGRDNSGVPVELSASDALSLAEFEAEIRRQILEDIALNNVDDQEDQS